jgi:hypothetical protein
MKLNLLKPRESVQSCIDRPDTRIAFLLVLIPTIVSIIGYSIYGFPFQWEDMGLSFVSSVLNWLLLSIVAYIILYFFKGKQFLAGKFSGIASALSLLWLVNLLLVIVGIFFFPLVFSPAVLDEAKLLATGQIEPAQFLAETGLILEQNPDAIALQYGIVAVAISVLLFLFCAYLVYLLVRDLYAGRIIPNLVITVILLFFWLFIVGWVFFLV